MYILEEKVVSAPFVCQVEGTSAPALIAFAGLHGDEGRSGSFGGDFDDGLVHRSQCRDLRRCEPQTVRQTCKPAPSKFVDRLGKVNALYRLPSTSELHLRRPRDHLAVVTHHVEKELPVSQIHTIDDAAGGGGGKGLAFLNNATIDVLVRPVESLFQRREHRSAWAVFAWADWLQYLRALALDLEAFEVFQKGIEGQDETVERFQSVENRVPFLPAEVVEHGPFLYFAVEEYKIVRRRSRGFALQSFYRDMIQPSHPPNVVLEKIGPGGSDMFQVMKHFLESNPVSAS